MDQSEKSQPDFLDLQRHVFIESIVEGEKVLKIGNEVIGEQLRQVLRDEAEYFLKSRFLEILNATIVNETVSMALIQSTDFKHVDSAKMLYHWNHVLKNMLVLLAKP